MRNELIGHRRGSVLTRLFQLISGGKVGYKAATNMGNGLPSNKPFEYFDFQTSVEVPKILATRHAWDNKYAMGRLGGNLSVIKVSGFEHKKHHGHYIVARFDL